MTFPSWLFDPLPWVLVGMALALAGVVLVIKIANAFLDAEDDWAPQHDCPWPKGERRRYYRHDTRLFDGAVEAPEIFEDARG